MKSKANHPTTSKEPSMKMDEFFALPAVLDLQEIQKRNPYGSFAHKAAHDKLDEMMVAIGADAFVGEY